MSDFSHSLALMARLTAANLRRRRREAAGLAAFAAVAVFALQLGLVLLIDCPRLFDRLALDQSAPDFAVVESEAAWSERQLDGLKANPAVRQCETERVIFARAAPVYNGTPTPTTVMLSDFDRPRRLDRPAQVDGAEALTDDAIYLPYAFKVGGGYDVGDRFTVELPGYDLDLEVAGFINEVFYGSLLRDWHRFYVTTAVWRDIAEQIPARVGVLLSVSLDDPAAADQMYLDYMTEEV
ncbi:MAG: hypothetical protein LBH76_03965, partial [Propionibacteriaceae bacterium]|nr:hypothetical protein [Propionibacteriaceae bacterium]